jgi:hypothetical protein
MPVKFIRICEISSSHGGEYEVQNFLLVMEAARTSETSVDNYLHGSTSQKTILNFLFLFVCFVCV